MRFKEIVLMTGFSFIGVLFTDPSNWTNWLLNIKVIAFIVIYVMAVFFLNSYAGYEHDMQSERLKSASLIPKPAYLMLMVVAIALFSLITLTINLSVFVITISAFLVWVLYYLPPLSLKSRALGGTLAHFIGGMLHFHMGYCSYSTLSGYSAAIAVLFALLLCMGHINHEILDYQADKTSGIRTTAVRLGAQRSHFLRTAFAVAALLYLATLYKHEILSLTTSVIFGIPTLVLAVLSITFQEKAPENFMKASRILVFLAGLALVIEKLLKAGII